MQIEHTQTPDVQQAGASWIVLGYKQCTSSNASSHREST
jgi:hypothetical protein